MMNLVTSFVASLDTAYTQATLGLLFSSAWTRGRLQLEQALLAHVSIEGPHGICSVGLMFLWLGRKPDVL